MYLNNTSNSLLAVAQTLNQFSLSVITGDTVLRCNGSNNLILQAGAGTSALTINPSNNILLNTPTTCVSSLNINGIATINNNTTINGVLNVSGNSNFNNAVTFNSSLNVSGTSILQGASTHLSSLNVVGNIIGSGTALTNLNYNAILNPPAQVNLNNPSTFLSTLNVSGNTTLNNITTINSSLNVSGTSILQGASTHLSTLNISGNTTCSGNIYSNGTVTCTQNIITNNSTVNTPQTGQFGNTGDRIILYNGDVSVYPYSLGINSSTLWYSVPTTASHIFYSGGTPYVQINSTGLTCAGDVIGFGSISDKRLKTNINKIDNSLDLINKLNPVKFTWKNDEYIIEEKRNTDDIGFIAQELLEILPFTTGKFKVLNTEKEFYNIKYERIIPYLVKSIQELTEKNNILENKLNYLYETLNIKH